jgi:hypothetical protein
MKIDDICMSQSILGEVYEKSATDFFNKFEDVLKLEKNGGTMRKTILAFVAVAIVVCLFAMISKLGANGAPILLQFAQDHLNLLRGGTLFLLFVGGILIWIKRRRSE